MSHHRLDYEAILRRTGHRITPQRLAILDAVCDAGGHISLGAIYARARHVDPSIDRSTVYRTLKLFVTLGLVVSADTGDGETYFEIAKPRRHHHLVCRQCGGEWEIDQSVMQPLFDQLLSQHGFSADSDHLVVFGLCQTCASLKRGEAS
jgi:Fe2+ or Zn2+ uptake regulation protein